MFEHDLRSIVVAQPRPFDRGLDIEPLLEMTTDDLKYRLRLAVIARRRNRKFDTSIAGQECRTQGMERPETAAQSAYGIIVETIEHGPDKQYHPLVGADVVCV